MSEEENISHHDHQLLSLPPGASPQHQRGEEERHYRRPHRRPHPPQIYPALLNVIERNMLNKLA